ncbi:hypothetical protein BaRGS_00038472, partial [Batillaria attramentaria]
SHSLDQLRHFKFLGSVMCPHIIMRIHIFFFTQECSACQNPRIVFSVGLHSDVTIPSPVTFVPCDSSLAGIICSLPRAAEPKWVYPRRADIAEGRDVTMSPEAIVPHIRSVTEDVTPGLVQSTPTPLTLTVSSNFPSHRFPPLVDTLPLAVDEQEETSKGLGEPQVAREASLVDEMPVECARTPDRVRSLVELKDVDGLVTEEKGGEDPLPQLEPEEVPALIAVDKHVARAADRDEMSQSTLSSTTTHDSTDALDTHGRPEKKTSVSVSTHSAGDADGSGGDGFVCSLNIQYQEVLKKKPVVVLERLPPASLESRVRMSGSGNSLMDSLTVDTDLDSLPDSCHSRRDRGNRTASAKAEKISPLTEMLEASSTVVNTAQLTSERVTSDKPRGKTGGRDDLCLWVDPKVASMSKTLHLACSNGKNADQIAFRKRPRLSGWPSSPPRAAPKHSPNYNLDKLRKQLKTVVATGLSSRKSPAAIPPQTAAPQGALKSAPPGGDKVSFPFKTPTTRDSLRGDTTPVASPSKEPPVDGWESCPDAIFDCDQHERPVAKHKKRSVGQSQLVADCEASGRVQGHVDNRENEREYYRHSQSHPPHSLPGQGHLTSACSSHAQTAPAASTTIADSGHASHLLPSTHSSVAAGQSADVRLSSVPSHSDTRNTDTTSRSSRTSVSSTVGSGSQNDDVCSISGSTSVGRAHVPNALPLTVSLAHDGQLIKRQAQDEHGQPEQNLTQAAIGSDHYFSMNSSDSQNVTSTSEPGANAVLQVTVYPGYPDSGVIGSGLSVRKKEETITRPSCTMASLTMASLTGEASRAESRATKVNPVLTAAACHDNSNDNDFQMLPHTVDDSIESCQQYSYETVQPPFAGITQTNCTALDIAIPMSDVTSSQGVDAGMDSGCVISCIEKTSPAYVIPHREEKVVVESDMDVMRNYYYGRDVSHSNGRSLVSGCCNHSTQSHAGEPTLPPQPTITHEPSPPTAAEDSSRAERGTASHTQKELVLTSQEDASASSWTEALEKHVREEMQEVDYRKPGDWLSHQGHLPVTGILFVNAHAARQRSATPQSPAGRSRALFRSLSDEPEQEKNAEFHDVDLASLAVPELCLFEAQQVSVGAEVEVSQQEDQGGDGEGEMFEIVNERDSPLPEDAVFDEGGNFITQKDGLGYIAESELGASVELDGTTSPAYVISSSDVVPAMCETKDVDCYDSDATLPYPRNDDDGDENDVTQADTQRTSRSERKARKEKKRRKRRHKQDKRKHALQDVNKPEVTVPAQPITKQYPKRSRQVELLDLAVLEKQAGRETVKKPKKGTKRHPLFKKRNQAVSKSPKNARKRKDEAANKTFSITQLKKIGQTRAAAVDKMISPATAAIIQTATHKHGKQAENGQHKKLETLSGLDVALTSVAVTGRSDHPAFRTHADSSLKCSLKDRSPPEVKFRGTGSARRGRRGQGHGSRRGRRGQGQRRRRRTVSTASNTGAVDGPGDNHPGEGDSDSVVPTHPLDKAFASVGGFLFSLLGKLSFSSARLHASLAASRQPPTCTAPRAGTDTTLRSRARLTREAYRYVVAYSSM